MTGRFAVLVSLLFAGSLAETVRTYQYTDVRSFSALGNHPAQLAIPEDAAKVLFLNLSYVSGSVACDTRPTKWGCGPGWATAVIIANASNVMVAPVFGQDGVVKVSSTSSGCKGIAAFWTLAGQDVYSPSIRVPMHNLTWLKADPLYLWYNEDLDYVTVGDVCSADNTGTTNFTYSVTYVPLCPDKKNVDPHQLLQPPTLAVSLTGDNIATDLRLPQMVPDRYGVKAFFAEPKTQAATTVAYPMPQQACYFGSAQTWDVWTLLKSASPAITTTDTAYTAKFAITVTWNETVAVTDSITIPRPSSATLNFQVAIKRTVSATSWITTLNSTLVWAYIAKSSALPVYTSAGALDHVSMAFELATVAVESGYSIESATFKQIGSTGSISDVSTPVQLSNTSGFQRWSMTATIASVCSLSAADTFTLQYTLVTGVAKSATHTGSITTSFGQLEAWCTLNTSTVVLSGSQGTYDADTAAASVTERFFIGDKVFVRAFVVSNTSVLSYTISSVVISGDASTAGAVTIYSSTSGASSKYGFVADVCPATSSAKACYHFTLADSVFKADKSLQITTSLLANIQRRKRADGQDSVTAVSQAFISSSKDTAVTPSAGTSLLPLAALVLALFSLAH